MFVQKAEIQNGEIQYGILGKVNADDLSPNIADKNRVHVQMLPVVTLTFEHGLGKRPAVTIVDKSGNEIEGDIKYIDDNNIEINFQYPTLFDLYMN
jgi:hypothetical protein